jgi:hypothetical protein
MPQTARYYTGQSAPAEVGRVVLKQILDLVKQGFYSCNWPMPGGSLEDRLTRVSELRISDDGRTITVVGADGRKHVFAYFLELELRPPTIGHPFGSISINCGNESGDAYIGNCTLVSPDRYDEPELARAYDAALEAAVAAIEAV